MVIDNVLVQEVSRLLGVQVSKREVLIAVLRYCGLTVEEAEEKVEEAMRGKWL